MNKKTKELTRRQDLANLGGGQDRIDQPGGDSSGFLSRDVGQESRREHVVRKRMLSRVLQRKLIPFAAHPKQPIFRVYNCVDLEKLHRCPPPGGRLLQETSTSLHEISSEVYTFGRFFGRQKSGLSAQIDNVCRFCR